MTTAETTRIGGRPRQVGQIHIEVLVANGLDRAKRISGEMDPFEVRSEGVGDVLIDTGAVMLCLPADLIARLGLPVEREVNVDTANGPAVMRLFSQVSLDVAGRHGLFECLETPTGTRPLLGAVPMEVLGIEPDVGMQSIRLLPEEPGRSYMNVYGANIP